MEINAATGWVLIGITRAVWILIVPGIVIIAACKLWHHIPRWISSTFLLSAVLGGVTAVFPLLTFLHWLSPEHCARLSTPLAVATGVVKIVFAVALLALAIRVRRMTEQNDGQISSESALPDELSS